MFTELPQREEPYPSSIVNAVDILRDIHRLSHTLLQKGNYSIHRIEFYLDNIIQDAVPLVLDLSQSSAENGIPEQWTISLMKIFTNLIDGLMEAHKSTLGVCVS